MAALVICMAGLNTRFHDVGFDIPKYLLPWREETIIYEILKQLGTFDEVLLLANKRDVYFMPDLIKTIEPLGLGKDNIHYIGDTNGQAHTAYIGASLLKNRVQTFFVHNADTLLIGRDFKSIESVMSDAYVDVFIANNPKYSYVRSKDGFVTEIAEKSSISPFASSGLYGKSLNRRILKARLAIYEDYGIKITRDPDDWGKGKAHLSRGVLVGKKDKLVI
jgi:dTDP-glucose pyrophosphorylase